MNYRTWDGREERLAAIRRYRMPKFTPMFYRTDDFLHCRRVRHLLEDALPVIQATYPGFHDREALALALVHDDAEMLTGDVLRYQKDRMTPQELRELDDKEEQAVYRLAKIFPQFFDGQNYLQLLLHALRKDSLEAQVVSYLDKVDAYCECLHEMHAGNVRFTGAAAAYVRHLDAYPRKYPALQPLIGTAPLFLPSGGYDPQKILSEATLHTAASVQTATGIPHYDRWRKITLEKFGIDVLVTVKEQANTIPSTEAF